MYQLIARISVLAIYFTGFAKPLDENQLIEVAQNLQISVKEAKETVTSWKQLKHKKSLIKAYEKKHVLKLRKDSNSVHYCDLKFISINELIKRSPEISYIKCYDAVSFDYMPFSLSEFVAYQPYQGVFAEPFVAVIPNGKVISDLGCIIYENNLIEECVSQNSSQEAYIHFLQKMSSFNFKKISGRVGVITRMDTSCYAHWVCDILPRLDFMQKAGIDYDYLYVPIYKNYMVETLRLLGIDKAKILTPCDYPCIQADELIFPSLTARRKQVSGQLFIESCPLCEFMPYWTISFLQKKFLPLIKPMLQSLINKNFSKKVFISRKDADGRKILNEDDVFAAFEKYGYVRYSLADLSFLEQVYLFRNADSIAGAHGAGLMNIVFCKKNTQIIEIFQERSTCTFCYLSQSLSLRYLPIKTVDFSFDGFVDTNVPLGVIISALKYLYGNTI